MIPEPWLAELNERMSREGIPHAGRPIRALMEWSTFARCSLDFASPAAEVVFKWFSDRSPAGSHDVLPVFIGALFYDATFWPVEVPMGYGAYRLDGRHAARSMPDPVWANMCRSRRDLAVFVELWADCLDYTYGIMQILHPGAPASDWMKFLASADKE
jgi:hypothetical protein